MKAFSILAAAACLASASGFVPVNDAARPSTSLNGFFNKVFGMDLFAPVSDQNDYGARNKKNLKTGKIGTGSYVPSGLSAAEYQKIRDEADAKKAANYQKNVAKAGKFIDYTDWYIKRGTDVKDSWIKDVNRGHTMAKTKFDWSGKSDPSKKYDGSA
uniref:PS II complex 12 kDa extrinsic protein n=1 Tax=Trieres chinensis TaxID=1514140 RepID=A0A7S2A531_TRICV